MEYESQEWLDSLTDEEYSEYVAQKIANNLEYLIVEGFVKTEVDENGEILYTMKTEEELKYELENVQ
jgi:hypothetical protein